MCLTFFKYPVSTANSQWSAGCCAWAAKAVDNVLIRNARRNGFKVLCVVKGSDGADCLK